MLITVFTRLTLLALTAVVTMVRALVEAQGEGLRLWRLDPARCWPDDVWGPGTLLRPDRGAVIGLRPMAFSDLAQVAAWLGEPHVARWWASGTTVEAEVEKYRRRVAGEDTATVILIVAEDGTRAKSASTMRSGSPGRPGEASVPR